MRSVGPRVSLPFGMACGDVGPRACLALPFFRRERRRIIGRSSFWTIWVDGLVACRPSLTVNDVIVAATSQVPALRCNFFWWEAWWSCTGVSTRIRTMWSLVLEELFPLSHGHIFHRIG